MATRLFTYGDVPMVIKQNQFLPGVFVDAWGVNLNAPATKASNLSIEYGEIVELNKKGLTANASYAIDRVDDATTAFGVVVRTTDGQISLEDQWVERPRSAQTLSVYPLISANKFGIVVPVAPSQTPTVGGAVYVRNVGDYAGAVQTAASSEGTAGTAISGWVFGSAKFRPTKGAGEAVIIIPA